MRPKKATESVATGNIASNGSTDLRQSSAIADIIQVERNRDTTGLWVMIALEKSRNFNYFINCYLILEPFWNGNTHLWHRHFSSGSKPGIHVLSRALTLSISGGAQRRPLHAVVSIHHHLLRISSQAHWIASGYSSQLSTNSCPLATDFSTVLASPFCHRCGSA